MTALDAKRFLELRLPGCNTEQQRQNILAWAAMSAHEPEVSPEERNRRIELGQAAIRREQCRRLREEYNLLLNDVKAGRVEAADKVLRLLTEAKQYLIGHREEGE